MEVVAGSRRKGGEGLILLLEGDNLMMRKLDVKVYVDSKKQ